jgi:hypothetical protein
MLLTRNEHSRILLQCIRLMCQSDASGVVALRFYCLVLTSCPLCAPMQRLKTAYWMELVHHKVTEYHKLEALRSPHVLDAGNNTADASTGAITAGTEGAVGEGAQTGDSAAHQARLRHLRGGSSPRSGSVAAGAVPTSNGMSVSSPEPSPAQRVLKATNTSKHVEKTGPWLW